MPQQPMSPAVTDTPASSAEYNKVIANIQDLDTRAVIVENRTTDTATSPGGIGNQRLADRLGSGVGTGANVTTGSASAQLADARARLAALEAASGGAAVMNTNAQTDNADTGSASYAASGTVCGLAFTSLASGKAKIDFGVLQASSSSSQIAYTTIEVRTGNVIGSGTVVLAASDDRSICTSTPGLLQGAGRTVLVTGLTSGSSYNVRLMHRSSSGTGVFRQRNVVVLTG